MPRITAAAPQALVSDSNNFAMCLGYSLADGLTFSNLNWQDANGSLYGCASWEASEEWLGKAQEPLERPSWDVDEVIDMEAAGRAQAALVVSTEPLLASPAALTAIGGMDGVAALTAMGLTAVQDA
ncbi:MAG: hypothetical protein RI906_3336 [Pseudomonadota bacterium]|jgi:hypothetical protein